MKKIVSLIFLVVFVASCTNDDSDEILYKEIQKSEKKTQFQKFENNRVLFGEVSDTIDSADTIVPPPPIDPSTICEGCPVDIDPPKGGTKP